MGNPFKTECDQLAGTIRTLRLRIEECNRLLAWREAFDPAATCRESRVVFASLDALKPRLEEGNRRVTRKEQVTSGLKARARLGLDPRYWFSRVRIRAAKDLAVALEHLGRERSRRDAILAEMEAKQFRVDELTAELHLFNDTDPDATRIEIRALEMQLIVHEKELTSLTASRDRLDAQLESPLGELRKLEAEIAENDSMTRHAQDFVNRLNQTASYEKRERHGIHEECAQRFDGESNPSHVLKRLGSRAAGLQRNRQKVEEAIDVIIRRATLNVRKVIIDGSNLGFSDGTFIGFSAAAAVANAIAQRCPVVLVFDWGMRSKIASAELSKYLGLGVELHVASEGRPADDTILALACEDDSYVISNDRFVDYAAHNAVSGCRILRHDIVGGRVMIHSLDINIRFEGTNPNQKSESGSVTLPPEGE